MPFECCRAGGLPWRAREGRGRDMQAALDRCNTEKLLGRLYFVLVSKSISSLDLSQGVST